MARWAPASTTAVALVVRISLSVPSSARDADAEAGVRAQVHPVLEDVSNRHHAPVAAAAGSISLFVQTACNQTDPETVLVIDAKDVAHDVGFVGQGRDIGAEVDEGDRACMGQVLELAASGRWVRWDNGTTGIHYEMRPDAGRDGIAGSCRAFRLKITGNYQHAKRTALACESGPGLWQLSEL